MNELLDKDDFLGLAHLLPEGAKDLVRLIGFEPTFLLIKHHGGTHFPVGQNYNKNGIGSEYALSSSYAIVFYRDIY